MKRIAVAMFAVALTLLTGCAGTARPLGENSQAATGGVRPSVAVDDSKDVNTMDAPAGENKDKPVSNDGVWVHEN